MDIVELTGVPYPAMPPSARVLVVLAKYAGLRRDPAGDSEHRRGPADPDRAHPAAARHRLRLRERAGAGSAATSSISSPGPVPGTSKAYWGPEIRVGAPQPALSVNMDAMTNVEELSFNFDKEKQGRSPSSIIQDPISKAPIGIPIPDVSPLNPPLGLVPPLPPKIEQPRRHRADVAALGADGRPRLCRASTATRCSAPAGSTSARYGRLLKSRQLVGVRGAGLPFDGLYYVKSVSHDIKRGEYKQSFALARNGLISTFPTVPV